MNTRRNWTHDETLLALQLYLETPFSKINSKHKSAVKLSSELGRTSSAVAIKLANFARLDPFLKARNISGMRNGSKLDEEVWNKYYGDWEILCIQCDNIRTLSTSNVQNPAKVPLDIHFETTDKLVWQKIRTKQSFFRKVVLASYQYECCITGINSTELLIASHIIPWAVAEEYRMDPQNGLCLNAMMDKAFDSGLITIDQNLKVVVSQIVLKNTNSVEYSYFSPVHGKPIKLPDRFSPKLKYLKYHNHEIFKQT
jgi:HNH endonuclease